MGRNSGKREREAEDRARSAELQRRRAHYERSEEAWEIANAKGIPWEVFKVTPLPPIFDGGDDDDEGEDSGPLYPWASPEEP